MLGKPLGAFVKWFLGIIVGTVFGGTLGISVGDPDGLILGTTVGKILRENFGASDGTLVGLLDSTMDCCRVGITVGSMLRSILGEH